VIAKILRGNDIKGLVNYLASGGRHNEHRDQRVIAAGPGVAADIGAPLTMEDAAALGLEMDLPRELHGTRVMQRVRRTDGARDEDGNLIKWSTDEAGEYVLAESSVWHLSVANPVDDRVLSDAEWAEVAGDLMDRLGFSAVPGRAPCPWVAIGHGPSEAGNDHMHIAVSLVREDGRAASTWQDRVKVGKACADYERRFGLTAIPARENGACPTPSRAEIEAAKKRDRPEPERDSLQRTVRASSVASRDEAEFVRRLHRQGLVVLPFYVKGSGRSQVSGYSVALRPAKRGDKLIPFAGGHLAPDLSLPKLRAAWPDSAADRDAAVLEWNGGSDRGGAGGTAAEPKTEPIPGRETKEWPPSAWRDAAEQAERVWRSMADIALDDATGWAQAAGDAAGVFGVLAGRLEADGPGPLSRAADVMADAAQRRDRRRDVRHTGGDLRGVAAVAAQAKLAGGTAAWALLVTEMLRMAKAIQAAQQAATGRSTSEAAAAAAAAVWEDVHDRYALAGVNAAGHDPWGRPGASEAPEAAPGPAPGRDEPYRSPSRPAPRQDERGGGFER
jgi:hypothetical protein